MKDSFLDTPLLPTSLTSTSIIPSEEKRLEEIPIIIEEGSYDPRLQLLSHSSRLLLHSCPRKYQLYKLNSKDSEVEDKDQGVTFSYGTAVGVGIQSVLAGKSEVEIYLDVFLAWTVDLEDRNPRQKKSFYEALFAVQRFIAMRESGYLDSYELVHIIDPKDGSKKAAVELSFKILLPEGFSYRGFVDAVLRHKETGAILVLECKTSSAQPNSANFKNSGQALGYSIVLDILFPTLSSYTVLYLVYYTKGREYIELPFEKSLLQKALWLQELLIDTKLIEVYERIGSYPQYGESCFSFFHECEYLGLCTLNLDNLTVPLTTTILKEMEEREAEYMYVVDFQELIEAQIQKGIQ